MLLSFITNILFPGYCLDCRKRMRDGVLCNDCFAKIEIRAGLVCGKCLAPIADAEARQSECHPSFPFVLGAAAGYHDQRVQSLIHSLKFRSISSAARPLAALLYRYATQAGLGFAGCVVLPIPLSRRRKRSRGYNQAELIARNFIKHFPANAGLRLRTDILYRARHTKPQSETVSAADREKNIKNAFAVAHFPANSESILGANIILIDDVATSGATLLAAAHALKAAGVADIVALAVAKT